jgi:hypothetical protein
MMERSLAAFEARADKKTTSAVNEPEEIGGDAGDGKDADSPENRQAFASKMSAAAHSASAGAFASGNAEDHKKSAMKHAMAFVANKMAGNKNEGDAHMAHVDKHCDAWGQCHETGEADGDE